MSLSDGEQEGRTARHQQGLGAWAILLQTDHPQQAALKPAELPKLEWGHSLTDGLNPIPLLRHISTALKLDTGSFHRHQFPVIVS